jgi:hypothetical protein
MDKCIVVDMDGTAALIGKRSPYDASRCDEVDTVNEPVRFVLELIKFKNNLSHEKIHIIIMSGRDSKDRAPTERWLAKHSIPYDALYMRAEGDRRKDSIIKKELYEAHIKGKYEVVLWLDDRNQIIDLVRKDLCLPCFQVNYGDF